MGANSENSFPEWLRNYTTDIAMKSINLLIIIRNSMYTEVRTVFLLNFFKIKLRMEKDRVGASYFYIFISLYLLFRYRRFLSPDAARADIRLTGCFLRISAILL